VPLRLVWLLACSALDLSRPCFGLSFQPPPGTVRPEPTICHICSPTLPHFALLQYTILRSPFCECVSGGSCVSRVAVLLARSYRTHSPSLPFATFSPFAEPSSGQFQHGAGGIDTTIALQCVFPHRDRSTYQYSTHNLQRHSRKAISPRHLLIATLGITSDSVTTFYRTVSDHPVSRQQLYISAFAPSRNLSLVEAHLFWRPR